MTTKVNERALVLEMLLAVNEEGQYSHLVLRDVLDKYQYLGKTGTRFSDAPDGRNAGKTADTGLCDRSVFQNQSKENETAHPQSYAHERLSDYVYGQCAGFRSVQRGGKACEKAWVFWPERFDQRCAA